MHRHQYKGRKLHRERDQREALVKGLADSLVKYESIETTLPKAKEVVPYVETLITKAKKGDLHNRRQVISGLQTIASAHKLVDEIAPKLKGRVSSHLRIEKTALRRGDNRPLALVCYLHDLKSAPVAKPADAQVSSVSKTKGVKPSAAKPVPKAPVTKAAVKPAQEVK